MSVYTFATENFTTFADLCRRPTLDKGQLVRLLGLFLALAMTFIVAAHRNDAAARPIDAPLRLGTTVP